LPAPVNALQLMRQLAPHNDVIAMQVYDLLALNLPKTAAC
jgi:hypothetical protein